MGFNFPQTFTKLRAIATMATALGIAFAGAAQAPAMASTDVDRTISQEQVAAIAKPGVVYVDINWKGFVGEVWEGETFWSDEISIWITCTGFAASPDGYVVTAGHCVDPQEVRADFLDTHLDNLVEAGEITYEESVQLWNDIAWTEWKVEGLTDGTLPTRSVYVYQTKAASGITVSDGIAANVVEFTPLDEGDVALLKVDPPSPMPSLEVASGDPQTGASITSIGYPADVQLAVDPSVEPSFKSGTVSGKQSRNGTPFIEISSPMKGGMSGGPAVDSQGKVIGVNSWGPTQDTETFNFVTSNTSLRALLSRNGVPLELSEADSTYRAGLDSYFSGDFAAAVTQFDSVLAAVPNHAQAQSFRTVASQNQADAPAPEPVTTESAAPAPISRDVEVSNSGGIPAVVGIGGAVLLAVLVAAVVILLRRKPDGVDTTNGNDA